MCALNVMLSNHPETIQFVEKWSSTKPVPRAKKVGDLSLTAWISLLDDLWDSDSD